MMPDNNFTELDRLRNEKLREPSKETKDNIDSSMGMFRFVGDIVDLFLPKLMEIFMHVAGGGKNKSN